MKRISHYYILILMLLIFFMFLVVTNISDNQSYSTKTKMISKLHLTDLCISTESRHTRHNSQFEPMAAFQDVPGWLDHFPSSTFLIPSDTLYKERFRTLPKREPKQ
jgi:hypothetical protein